MNLKPKCFIETLEARKKLSYDESNQYIPTDIQQSRQSANKFDLELREYLVPRDDVTITTTELGRASCYHAKPCGKTERIILHLHSGAYVLDFNAFENTNKTYITHLAQMAAADVYSIDYRVAPEHPYPAALEDAYDAYLALLEKGFAPKTIFITGDSAGGGLALALLLKIRDNRVPLPAGGIAISPWTDLACTGQSMKERAILDPMLKPESLIDRAMTYSGGHNITDPYVSPLYGNYEDLPPLMFIVGGREVLYDDTARVAAKAKTARVEVLVDIVDEMFHTYPLFVGILSQSSDAITRTASFMRKQG